MKGEKNEEVKFMLRLYLVTRLRLCFVENEDATRLVKKKTHFTVYGSHMFLRPRCRKRKSSKIVPVGPVPVHNSKYIESGPT
jgi:hypothetical protein